MKLTESIGIPMDVDLDIDRMMDELKQEKQAMLTSFYERMAILETVKEFLYSQHRSQQRTQSRQELHITIHKPKKALTLNPFPTKRLSARQAILAVFPQSGGSYSKPEIMKLMGRETSNHTNRAIEVALAELSKNEKYLAREGASSPKGLKRGTTWRRYRLVSKAPPLKKHSNIYANMTQSLAIMDVATKYAGLTNRQISEHLENGGFEFKTTSPYDSVVVCVNKLRKAGKLVIAPRPLHAKNYPNKHYLPGQIPEESHGK